MDNKAFLFAYKNLNPAQKKAVDAIEGPVMVIAGPGTGKTRVLTLRIANILRITDTAPENILALTFTESGVHSMRKNLANIIGGLAYRVRIATFHGFCNEIIKEYPEAFPDIIGGTHIRTVGMIRVLEDIISSLPLEALKPPRRMFHHLYPVLKKIGEVKKDGISPQELDKIVRAEKRSLLSELRAKNGKMTGKDNERTRAVKKNEEFVRIYKAYQEALRRNGFYDYDDMIIEVLRIFSGNKNLLLEVQERYQYVLADEHQDANRAQNKVLELLSSFHAPAPNLFIVGDEKQAIFRFQGASLDNFFYFQKLYPDALLVSLDVNYRSTRTILDAAGSVIEKREKYRVLGDEKLSAHKKVTGRKISLYEFTAPDYEMRFIVDDINRKVKKEKIFPGDIAVLYRDNKDAFPLADTLERAGISFTIESDQDILEDPDIAKIMVLLRAVHHFGDDVFLVPALHIDYLGISNLDLYTLIELARKGKTTVTRLISSQAGRKRLELEDRKRLGDFYEKLSRWKTLAENRGFLDVLDVVVRESGYLEYALSLPDAAKKIKDLTDLYENAKEEGGSERFSLSDFLGYVDLLERYQIAIRRSVGANLLESVHLMTAHRSKGLEFGHVYIIGAGDRHWGNRRMRNDSTFMLPSGGKEDGLEDERRLFYVALTRAKDEATITYSSRDRSGNSRLPSVFLLEMDQKHLRKVPTRVIEERFEKERGAHLKLSRAERPKDEEHTYYRKLFEERGLNVTALNNYLKCPWRYFYRNLIRIPESENASLLFGTAIHEGLRRFFDKRRKGRDVGKRGLVKFFREELARLPFEEKESALFIKKGVSAVSGYYEKYRHAWSRDFLNEFPVGGVFFSDGTRLSGKIDRVEFLSGSGNVRVVDYKTGRPRSRNEIMGKTKTSDGDYFRQLVFYKMLLETFDGKKFSVNEGIVEFVEPDARGRWIREVFPLSDKDVRGLREEIERVVSEIKNLSFWDTKCGERTCEYCRLRFGHPKS